MASDAKTIAAKFESLGGGGRNPTGWAFGCEFGYWQRSLDLEPLGLLRWASISPANLLCGLQTGFAGVEGEASIELREHTADDWGYTQTTYGMHMDHTYMPRDLVPPALAKRTIAQSMGFLRNKLIEDLRLGEKLFVYRTYDHTLDHDMQAALADAVSSYGKGVLFYVQITPDGHPPFTAVRKAPNLIVGHIDRFVPINNTLVYNDSGWEAVCRAAIDVWAATAVIADPARPTRLRRWLGI